MTGVSICGSPEKTPISTAVNTAGTSSAINTRTISNRVYIDLDFFFLSSLFIISYLSHIAKAFYCILIIIRLSG